jgi:hypothetical protein
LRIRIPDPDPGFDDLKLKKIYSWKFNFYFLDQELQFPYPEASIKDAQATGEAFSPKNMKILYFFFYFCGSFLPSWIRIRIRNLNAYPDPDPATQFVLQCIATPVTVLEMVDTSVVDPYVFGPPRSGSFHHQSKIVRKILISSVL